MRRGPLQIDLDILETIDSFDKTMHIIHIANTTPNRFYRTIAELMDRGLVEKRGIPSTATRPLSTNPQIRMAYRFHLTPMGRTVVDHYRQIKAHLPVSQFFRRIRPHTDRMVTQEAMMDE